VTDYCIALHYGSPTVIITAQRALYSMAVPHVGSPVGQVQFRQMGGGREIEPLRYITFVSEELRSSTR